MTPTPPPEANPQPPLMKPDSSPILHQGDRLMETYSISTVSPELLGQRVSSATDWATDETTLAPMARVMDVADSIAPPERYVEPVFSSDAALLSSIASVEIQVYQADNPEIEDPELGQTQKQSVQQELRIKAGDEFDEASLRQDLQHLYQLGLFSDAGAIVTDTTEGKQIQYKLVENSPSQFSFGGGTDQFVGTFGSVSYRNQAIGTLGQRTDLTLQLSTTGDIQFRGSFFSPYLLSQPDRWGYRISLFRDRVQAGRIGASVSLHRPIGGWQASLGLDYARITIHDRDSQGQPLSFSGADQDDLFTLSFGMTLDQRNNPFNPSRGWILSLGTEQSLPIGLGNVLANRLQANFLQYIPLTDGEPTNQFSETLVFRAEAATILGDLRPYRSWQVNDPNFVRLDNVRSYLLASTEYRFPIASMPIFGASVPIGGVIFLDFASDLGSGDAVPGRSSSNLGGSGFGYGLGLRARSPLGLFRLDLGFTNQGELKVQAGVNQRF